MKTKAVFYSISTLLTRNLHDVFGENDPARRRAAIDEIFTEDCVFYDPKGGVYRGRDEIDRIAGAVKATHPDFRYQPIAEPEEVGNGGRVQWVSGRPDEAPASRRSARINSSGRQRSTGLMPGTTIVLARRRVEDHATPGGRRHERPNRVTPQMVCQIPDGMHQPRNSDEPVRSKSRV